MHVAAVVYVGSCICRLLCCASLDLCNARTTLK